MSHPPLAIVPKISSALVSYLEGQKISKIIVDVELVEEPCTQIRSPIVRILPRKHQQTVTTNSNAIVIVGGIRCEFTPAFFSTFSPQREIFFELKGLLRKRVEITNIDPIITNICKVKYP